MSDRPGAAPDPNAAYRDSRARIVALAAEHLAADPSLAGVHVPCCPEWTVTDLLAHVAGGAADLVAMRLDGVGTDPWTDAQVKARRGRTVDELLAEIRSVGAELDAMFAPGTMSAQLVFDTVTHEHDLRGVLGAPGERDAEAVLVGAKWVVGAFAASVGTRAPVLAVELGDAARRVCGPDRSAEPVATLRAEPFDLLRACSGRRSEAQIRALDWSTDPTPWLPCFTFGPFRPRADDVIE